MMLCLTMLQFKVRLRTVTMQLFGQTTKPNLTKQPLAVVCQYFENLPFWYIFLAEYMTVLTYMYNQL